MKNGNTKQEILDTALTLFSVQGFEATSISQIADAVGIRKASLYSHFASKQDILDAIVEWILGQYDNHSVFVNSNWDDEAFTKDKQNLSSKDVEQMIIMQIHYIVHDPLISKSRKMLTIEQFRNTQMAQLQTKQNYTDIMNYFAGIMGFLIRQGKLKDLDAQLMAAQLCLPITVWMNLCDREPERESEVMDLVHRHIKQFFRLYSTDE